MTSFLFLSETIFGWMTHIISWIFCSPISWSSESTDNGSGVAREKEEDNEEGDNLSVTAVKELNIKIITLQRFF